MIVIVVLAIGAMIAVAVVNSMGGQKTYTARESFNRLMNYVVSGSDSVVAVDGKYSNDSTYYFNTQQKNLENREVLYMTTSTLLNDFMKSYSVLADKDKFSSNVGEFEKIMQNEGEILEFAKITQTKTVPTLVSVTSIYVENGRDAAIEYLDSYYDFGSVTNNSYLSEYQTEYLNYKKNAMDTIDLYYKNDCCYAGAINYSCMQKKGLQKEADRLDESLRKIRTDLKKYSDVTSAIVANLFNANAILGGGNA